MRHGVFPGRRHWWRRRRADLADDRLALTCVRDASGTGRHKLEDAGSAPGAGSASKLKPEDARCGVVDCVGGGNLGEGIGDVRGDARGDDSSSTIIASKSASSSPSKEGRGDARGDTRGDVPGPHASKRAPRWWSSVRGEVTFFFGEERFFGDGLFGGGEKKASTPVLSTSWRWGVSSASTLPQVGPLSCESSLTT